MTIDGGAVVEARESGGTGGQRSHRRRKAEDGCRTLRELPYAKLANWTHLSAHFETFVMCDDGRKIPEVECQLAIASRQAHLSCRRDFSSSDLGQVLMF